MGSRLAAPSPLLLRTYLVTLLLAGVAMLAFAGSASAAVTQKQAAKKALAALGTETRTDPVIVFGLPRPIKAGTKITQAGTTKPSTGSSKGLSSKLRSAGVRTVRAPSVLNAASRSYFFFEDRAPFQLFQHPGRVAIVDVQTGKVRLSRTIMWPPLLNGRLPAFLKNAAAYRSAKYQVLYRPWVADPAAQQPRVAQRNLFDLDPFGPGKPLPDVANSKAIADRLAAERSCVLRVTDTLPTFWNVNDLNMTRSYVGTLFEKLERDNGGFIDDRYGARSGETLAEAVDRLSDAGCKDILLYIAGQGYDQDGEPVIQLGTSVRKGGLIAQQNISATDLRKLVSDRAGITFKFKFDAPYSGGFVERLRDLPNVLLIETPAPEGASAFAFIPEVSQNGQIVSATTNPGGLLEFTNCELYGFKAFFESAEEIDKATQAQIEGVSFLAEMLARSQELCEGIGFADDMGSTPQLYAAKRGSGKGTNLPPKAEDQNVTVSEDTPKAITLVGTDPDGDPLTYTVTKQPDHGTLSGSGANLTYTPNANYVGADDFKFKVDDPKGAGSNTAQVSINVTAVNDAPVVTNSSGSTAYTEQKAAVVVDPNATVSDVDDTNLEGATVKVTDATRQAGDNLVFNAQNGITGTYDSGTGVLTLTGSSSVANYQTALRSIKYENLANHNPSSPKAIEFVVNDGSASSAASTKNIAVTGENDAPTVNTTGSTLAYSENEGEKAVDDGITVADVDSANLTGATVQITSNHAQAEDDLTFDNSNGLGVTGSYDDSTGTLTLTGTASVSNYQAALRLVKYRNTSESPSTATRTVSFQVDDGAPSDNLSNVATRDVSVSVADDAPVANDDSATVNEDSSASAASNEFDVLANDTDVDGGPMEIQSITQPANGTATLVQGSPDTIEYAPDPNYCNSTANPAAPDTFTYTLNGGDTATVSVTVTCANDAPTVDTTNAALAYSENEGEKAVDDGITVADVDSANLTGATVQITSNHAQAEDDLTFDNSNGLGVTGSYNDSTGTLTLTGTASVSNYQAALRLVKYRNTSETPSTLTRTVSFRVDDGAPSNNLSNVATRDINVSVADDAPVANDDSATVTEDSSASAASNEFDVLSNDTDVDGGPMEIESVSNPDHGTATVVQGSPDTIEYSPDADYCNSNANPAAPDTITYTLNGGDTATVSVTVTCVDDPPVANDDSPTVTEDTETDLSVLSNDTDVDGDQIEITNVTNPTNGTAAIKQGTPDQVTYKPNANYCGSDSFTYTINGGDTATVSVTVSCVNDAPVANDDTATVGEDSGATEFTVLSNDTDTESDAIEITNVTSPSTPGGGTVTVVDGSPDKVAYTPAANYCNTPPGTTPDTFTYTVNGGDTATVSVTVNCVDDAPVASDDAATVGEDSGPNDLNVVANDNDVEGDAIDITQITDQPDNGTATIKAGTPEQITYTPNSNYCNSNASPAAPDTITYEVNGGDTATVSVTVTCADDAHVANDDSATVSEDSGTTELNVTANDSDVENDAIQITGVTQPASGTGTAAVVDGSPDKVSYTPPANYCNNPPGTALAEFTYTVAGGDTATVTVTVNCDDDNPTAVDDSMTVNEDSTAATPANTITVTANDTDVDGGTIQVQSTTNGTKGTTTHSGGDVTYVPTADQCGPDSFTYTLNGGSQATVNVTITCVNDAPVADLNGNGAGVNSSAIFNEPGPAVAVAPDAVVSDVDDTDIQSATITLTNRPDDTAESLSVDTTGTAVTAGTYDSGTGVLTLTGPASKDDFAAVLKTLKYNNTATPPNPTTRTVQVTVNDGDTDSPVATASVTVVPLNIAPTLDLNGGGAGENESASFVEDGGAVSVAPAADANDTDDTNLESATIVLTNRPDNTAESISVSTAGTSVNASAYDSSTGTITLTGSRPIAEYEQVLQSTTYNNTSQTPDTTARSITFKVNDGAADSPTRTSTVSVATVNDKPVNSVPGTQTFNEDTSRTFSSANGNLLSVSDPDAGNGAVQVTLTVTTGTLTVADVSGVATTSGNGTSSVVLTDNITDVNTALASGVTYQPPSNANGTFTLTMTTNDQGNSGGPAESDTDNVTLDVQAQNDAPQNTVPGAQTVDEDTSLFFNSGNGNAISVADADIPAGDIRISLSVQNGGLTIPAAARPALNFACVGCTGDGVGDLSMVFEGTMAEVAAALDGLEYRGTLNYNGSDQLSITSDDRGQTGAGGTLTSTSTVNITVTPVNDAPSADAETFGGAGNLDDQAHGNTTYQVDDTSGDNKSAPTHPHSEVERTGISILDGDTDVDGPGPLIVQSAGSDAGATNGQTADGGTVTVEQDGDFVYNPPASTSCDNGTDSFNYKISDQQNTGSGPIPGTSIGTVTIHLEGCVWYVHNNAVGNAGTSTHPFDTLAQAETASGANHTVFVFDGDNTSTGYQTGFAMNSGERLIGEHESLTHDQDQGGAMTADTLHPANPGAHPTISGTNEDVVDLDDGNEVRGFNIDPTGTGSGIAGASGDTGGATIDDVNILDTAVAGSQPLLELDSTTGTFSISNLVVNNQAAASPQNTATGVRLSNAGTVRFDPNTQISIGINGAKGLEALANTNLRDSTFDDITVAGSSAGGIRLDATTGNAGDVLRLGDGTGSDLSLTTTSGSDAALRVNNHTTSAIHVESAGTDGLHATGGPALDVTGTSAVLLGFDDVDSLNSANDGINLDGTGAGRLDPTDSQTYTFKASSGDINGYSGIGFDVNAGSGAITYPGTFGNGSGTFVADITGRTGGAISLSGSISDTNDSGGGINVVGNSGGTTTFSGSTKQLNTASTDAVDFQASNGHTLTLSGGGTDIDTTSGRGIDADNSGTFELSGSGNTILTDTGRGINIAQTDIPAADVTVESVRVNSDLSGSGPDFGIRLDSTGSAGNLNVTGTGGDCTSTATCTGGVIHNTTDDGVTLTSAAGTSLTDLYIGDSDGSGIYAPSGTSNNNFNDLHIHNNGNAVASVAEPDAGIFFGPMTGTNSITGTSAGAGATTVQQSRNNQIEWDTNTGTGTLNISNTDVLNAGQGAGTGANGISTVARSSAVAHLNVGNGGAGSGDVDITNNPADGILTNSTDDSTITSDVDNVNFSTGNRAVNHSGGSTSDTTFRINNSDITNYNQSHLSAASTLSINPTVNAQFDGTVTQNRIGTAGTTRSGAGAQVGIAVGIEDGSDMDLNISNNIVQHTAKEGIFVYARDFLQSGGSISNANVTVRDNAVGPIDNVDPAEPSPPSNLNGIEVEASDDANMCADIANNDSSSFGSSSTTGTELRTLQVEQSIFRLEGLPANSNNESTVETFLNGRNPLIPVVEIDAFIHQDGTPEGYIAEPGNCPMPTLP